jgi:hypothetical protein
MKPNIQVFYRISVRDDKTGKIVKKGRLRRSKSFVLQFLQIIQSNAFNANLTVKDTGGTNQTLIPGLGGNMQGGVGDQTYGIVVGTGSTTVTNTDNKLATQIATGSGSGQLNYGLESQVAAQVVGANVDYTNTRTFQNLSGATITINEIGLYVLTSASGQKYCIIHDLATQAVLNNQTATVTYTLRTTA